MSGKGLHRNLRIDSFHFLVEGFEGFSKGLWAKGGVGGVLALRCMPHRALPACRM